MSSANNSTMENVPMDNTDNEPSLTFGILFGILLVTGTLANGYIIVVLLQKSRRSPLNMTIVNLAIVDSLILALVIPMCLVTLALPDVATSLCCVNGILGPLLATYSLQVQCLILYTTARNVTEVSQNPKAAARLIRLALTSVICLTVDTCVVAYSSVVHGDLQKVPSIGYCYITYGNVFRDLMTAFYGSNLLGSILLCNILYCVMTLYVRKNSASQSLARQRHLIIFKMIFRKLVVWVLSYSFITLVRLVGYKNKWPEVTFQLSYFLLWSNCVMNPLCHILTSHKRKMFSWCSERVATVAPQRGAQLGDRRNDRGNNQPERNELKTGNHPSRDLDRQFTVKTLRVSSAEESTIEFRSIQATAKRNDDGSSKITPYTGQEDSETHQTFVKDRFL